MNFICEVQLMDQRIRICLEHVWKSGKWLLAGKIEGISQQQNPPRARHKCAIQTADMKVIWAINNGPSSNHWGLTKRSDQVERWHWTNEPLWMGSCMCCGLEHHSPYRELGADTYDTQQRERDLNSLRRKAAKLGIVLVVPDLAPQQPLSSSA